MISFKADSTTGATAFDFAVVVAPFCQPPVGVPPFFVGHLTVQMDFAPDFRK